MTQQGSGQLDALRRQPKMLGGAGHHEHRGSFLLTLGVQRWIGQHGECYDPSTVKRRERSKKANPFQATRAQWAALISISKALSQTPAFTARPQLGFIVSWKKHL